MAHRGGCGQVSHQVGAVWGHQSTVLPDDLWGGDPEALLGGPALKWAVSADTQLRFLPGLEAREEAEGMARGPWGLPEENRW